MTCFTSVLARFLIVLVPTLTLSACSSSDCGGSGGGGSFVGDVILLAAQASCYGIAAASESDDSQATAAGKSYAGTLNEMRLKAENNDPAAQYQVGMTSPTSAERQFWLCRSASQPHDLQDDAMFQLGMLSENRLGDKPAAYRWYTLARQHGNVASEQAVQSVRKSLTLDEASAAEQAARNWKPGDCGRIPNVVI